MDGWNTIVSFLGPGLFSVAMPKPPNQAESRKDPVIRVRMNGAWRIVPFRKSLLGCPAGT